MRGWQPLESFLRKGTSVFSGCIAEGDNQCLLGEDGGKLKVVVLVDAKTSRSIIPIAATAPIPQL
jgi:hypothetical protein